MKSCTKLIRLGVLPWSVVLLWPVVATGTAADTTHITEWDVRVTQEGGTTISTYCTSKSFSATGNRRAAIAGAGRAIVQAREGVVMSGAVSLSLGSYGERIQEDTFGVVGPLELLGEDPFGGIANDLWCVKVMEVPRK